MSFTFSMKNLTDPEPVPAPPGKALRMYAKKLALAEAERLQRTKQLALSNRRVIPSKKPAVALPTAFLDPWTESIVVRPGVAADERIPLSQVNTLERALARVLSFEGRPWATSAILRHIVDLAGEHHGFTVPERVFREGTLYYVYEDDKPVSASRDNPDGYLPDGLAPRDRDSGHIPPAEQTRRDLSLGSSLESSGPWLRV